MCSPQACEALEFLTSSQRISKVSAALAAPKVVWHPSSASQYLSKVSDASKVVGPPSFASQ